jgi:ketosteroid isomerase-like protein
MLQENVKVMQSLYEAVNRRDYASAGEYLHPEAEVCPGLVGFDTAGARSRSRLRGRDEVRKFFEDNGEIWQEWTVKSEEVTETPDGRLLAVERWYARGRDGIDFDFEVTDVYTFRDGLVARVDGYLDKAEALEAAGLSE